MNIGKNEKNIEKYYDLQIHIRRNVKRLSSYYIWLTVDENRWFNLKMCIIILSPITKNDTVNTVNKERKCRW
jgi:hypothetical protein